MQHDFDFLVFIGRFQPVHRGHLAVITQALGCADQLIVLIGSAHMPPNTRNPWSVASRERMLRASLDSGDSARLLTAPLMDVPYNEALWVSNAQRTVQGLVTAHHAIPHREPRIGLIGHSKDHSAYYLKRFPQWSGVEAANFRGLSATPLREALFADPQGFLASSEAADSLSPGVLETLDKQIQDADFATLQTEQQFIARYREGWQQAPYAPTFVTVDAVVVQSGHVLLVRRRAQPGAGLLALPGGFVGQHERLQDACIRELREETRLKVPAPVLHGSIRNSRVFDDPYRSTRGRTITHAYHIELPPDTRLPKVRGADDAAQAQWLPLAELDPQTLFEDHYFIIQDLIGL